MWWNDVYFQHGLSYQERIFLEIINNFGFAIVTSYRIMKTSFSTIDSTLNSIRLIEISIKKSCNKSSDYFELSADCSEKQN